MAKDTKKTKADDIPECPYGARCYRKNPQHLLEYSHPKKSKTDDSSDGSNTDAVDGPSSKSPSKTDDSSLPPCKYGASCYRKNLMHFAEYSHPTKAASKDDSDTDELSDDDDAPKTDVKSSDILKRGMSLVKSYSKMTEEERKELIKKAFEAKKQLEEELDKTKTEMKKMGEQVEKLNKQVATGLLLMDGEKEILEGNEVKYFDLAPERSYKEGSAAQTHFRLAESQFYRLLSGSHAASNCRLTKVEYVVNPELAREFKKCREKLKNSRGEEFSYPVLGFHGTLEKNIVPICETGFKIPGHSGHQHRTDTGWYGKGVYFSEYPAYSMGYIQGSSKLLLCQVLPGKVFQCTKLIHGAALQKGCDSHMSPCKKELVIFNKYHILPSYIVHYSNTTNEFKYGGDSAKPGPAPKAATSTAKKKAKKGDCPTDPNDMHDSILASDKYFQAKDKKKSKCLNGYQVQFTGTFADTQKGMLDLATKHGATAGTKAVFNLLIASETEFSIQTNKVLQANKKCVPIVPEMYLYDCIINNKKYDTDPYEFSD